MNTLVRGRAPDTPDCTGGRGAVAYGGLQCRWATSLNQSTTLTQRSPAQALTDTMPKPESSISQTTLNDVLPHIESNLTIEEIAEKLGISVEAACALVLAAIRNNPAKA